MESERIFSGQIIKESLKDISILEKFDIVHTRIDDEWTILTVRASRDDIHRLKGNFKVGTWYAHFWNREELIVVFNDKIVLDREQAIKYGKSLGFPEEQLDFPTDI